MANIKTIVEVTWEEDGSEKKANYKLLHWGLRYDMVPDSYGNLVPVHYTVAICENIKTGAVELFMPDQLRILGINIKEEEL